MNSMLGKSCDVVGKEEVGAVRDDYLTAVGGRNAYIYGVAGATSCVHKYCPFVRLDT